MNYREYNNFENFKSQPRLRITNSLLGFLVFINSVAVIIFSRKDKIYRQNKLMLKVKNHFLAYFTYFNCSIAFKG